MIAQLVTLPNQLVSKEDSEQTNQFTSSFLLSPLFYVSPNHSLKHSMSKESMELSSSSTLYYSRILLTPLSCPSSYTIKEYLGNLSLHFIRESWYFIMEIESFSVGISKKTVKLMSTSTNSYWKSLQ